MPGNDVQIKPLGSGAAPQSWVLPGTTLIVPKVVRATFNGGGAAVPFLPTLVITSDSGDVVASTTAAAEVAAGASADVSFFPGGSNAATSGLSLATVAISVSSSGDSQLVAAVTSHRIRVVQVGLMANGNVGVKFTGSGDLTGTYPLTANTGFVLGPCPDDRWWFQTDVGAALNINLSAAVAVGGVLGYVIE